MSIKGVLFDLDGTLTRPGAIDFSMLKSELGCPAGSPVLEFIEAEPPDSRARLMRILEKREMTAAETSRPNLGAERCLSILMSRDIPFGIITRNGLSSVEQALLKFDVVTIRDFSAVITRDSSLPKPCPDGVYIAAGKMGLMPSELILVGDFRFDIIAGHAAGAVTALLTNKGESPLCPDDPEPDYIIDRLDEILDLPGFPCY